MYQFDLIFSNWMFVWFLLYQMKITSYNPKIAFILGLIINACLISLMIYYNNSFIYIFLFSVLIFIFKFIPFWILRNTNLRLKDFYALLILFFIYVIWIGGFNLESYIKNNNDIIANIKNNKPTNPFIKYVLNKIDM